MKNKQNSHSGSSCRRFTLPVGLRLLIFMLLMCEVVVANDASQTHKVTLNLQQCSVNTLFREIRKQTGLRFVYNEAYVKDLSNIDVEVREQSVKEVLDNVFRKTPYECRLEDEVIYIVPAPLPIAKENKTSEEKSVKIRGKVTDQSGAPLPGVSVVLDGTTTGVSTNIDGNYELMVPQTKQVVLVFSFVGMKTQKVPFRGQSVLNVMLEDDRVALEDVVVIGYGERKKGTLTGSVAVVEAKKMEMMPVTNLEQALQGQTAGVQILGNSGKPGESSKVYIRGINSITAGTDPLYVMDGVVISAADFSALNMSDMESVNVLKDASSTSIYGARAANGVVLITSKKGRYGQDARVNLKAQFGWSALAYGKVDLMNTKERLDYEEMIYYNDDNPNWNRADYENTNVDWIKEIYNSSAPMSSYDLSVIGGSEKLSYYLAGGYYRQKGIAPNSDFKRYSFKLNLEGRFNPWLKMGGTMTVGYEENANIVSAVADNMGNPANAAVFMLPYWNPYKPDGSLATKEDNSFLGTDNNPLDLYANGGRKKDNYAKIVGALFVEIEPVEGLRLKTALGLDAGDKRGTNIGYPEYYSNRGDGNVSEAFLRQYTLTLTNTANYVFQLGEEHHFNVLAGQEAIRYRANSFSAVGTGLTDNRIMSIGQATTPYAVDGSDAEYTYLSWFGRISYDWKSKYFLDLSVRGDGSSRFGADNRWASFWSAGVMWRMKDENFLKDSPVITNASVSASVGTSGNSSIGNYSHRKLVLTGGVYVGGAAYVIDSPGNEKLGWEHLRDFNLSLKFGFWDRLNVTVEAYNKVTTEMLMQVPVSVTTGFPARWNNVGKMRNNGIEFSLDVDVLKFSDFLWNFNGNASYNKNKIVELYDGADSYLVGNSGILLKEGESVGSIQAVRYAGVNPANGDALWYDKDGNLTNVYNTSDEVLLNGKNSNAPWNGGFTNTFTYKGLSLSVFFNWVKGRYMYNNTRFMLESNGSFVQYNQSSRMLNAWRKPGDITDIPRYGVYSQPDSRFIEDASFLRLKNVMLSYSLPQSWLERTKVFQNVRIFAQAQNLLTFTKYQGMDPESPANLTLGDYPHTRQYTFGLDLTF